MTTISNFFKKHWVLIGILISSLLLKALLIARPFETIISNFLPDDSFYYFQIVRNILAGHGSAFDGINFTNGYHPLWMVLIMPVFKIFSNHSVFDVAPLYATLIFSVIIEIATIVLLYVIISRYTSKNWIKGFALFLWCFNPFVIYEIFNGLETSVSLLLITLFFLLFVTFAERITTTRAIILGIVGGLMMLARLDNVFYFFFFLIWIIVSQRKLLNKTVIISGIAATIVVSPWLIWNYIHSGMFFTSASVTSTVVNHQLIVQDHGPSLAQQVKAVIYTTYNGIQSLLDKTGIPELALIILGAAIMLGLLNKEKIKPQLRAIILKPELVLFIGFIANFVINASVRWTYRSWYFIAFNIFFVIGVAWFLNKSEQFIPYKKVVVSALVVMSIFTFYVGYSKELQNREVAQREMYASAQWMNENLPTGTKIGVFNAGIQGYFSRHTVVNLDGLVNNAASDAMINKKLWEYIDREQIEYISDFDIYLNYRYKSFLGIDNPFDRLELVHNISLNQHTRSDSGINIYKVIR